MSERTVILHSVQDTSVSITLGGNADERTTLVPCGYPPYPDFLAPEFVPLKHLRITNAGDQPVRAPRVLCQARSGLAWSLGEIAREIVDGLAEDRCRVRAVQEFVGERLRFGQDPEYALEGMEAAQTMAGAWPYYEGYGTTRGQETHGALRQLHAYGCGNCVTACLLFNALCGELGYRTRIVHIRNHFVSEIYHDGQWRMYDPLCRGTARRDGLPLGVADICREPGVMRTVRWHFPANYERIREDGTYGNGPSALDALTDPQTGLFSQNIERQARMPDQEQALELTLLPGDSIEWRSRFEGLFHTWMAPNQYNWVRPPHRCANGTLRRTLRLAPGRTETLLRLPYPIVGGRVLCAFAQSVRATAAVLPEGAHDGAGQLLCFRRVAGAGQRPGEAGDEGGFEADLGQVIQPLQAPAVRQVRLVLDTEAARGDAGTAGTEERVATVELYFQHNPDALPELVCGGNEWRVRWSGPGQRIELSLGWEERHVPATPAPTPPRLGVDESGVLTAECAPVGGTTLYHFQVRPETTPFFPAESYSFERMPAEPRAVFAGVELLQPGRHLARARAKALGAAWSDWSQAQAFLVVPGRNIIPEERSA